MALVVEDGTGLINAESYLSVADFKQYHQLRGNQVVQSDTDIERALRNATDYMDLVYGTRFLGDTLFPDVPQALFFPTTWWEDPIPLNLENATAEFGLAALVDDLFFAPTIDPSGKIVTLTKVKVGPIEDITEYSKTNTADIRKRSFPKAEKWILPLITGVGGGAIR